MNGKLVKPGLAAAEKEIIEKAFPLPTPVPAVGPGETLEDILGPGIKMVRARPRASVWNPNPSTMRGQTIESITTASDGIECTYYPKCNVVHLRKAPELGGVEGAEVWIPFENFFWALSKEK